MEAWAILDLQGSIVSERMSPNFAVAELPAAKPLTGYVFVGAVGVGWYDEARIVATKPSMAVVVEMAIRRLFLAQIKPDIELAATQIQPKFRNIAPPPRDRLHEDGHNIVLRLHNCRRVIPPDPDPRHYVGDDEFLFLAFLTEFYRPHKER